MEYIFNYFKQLIAIIVSITMVVTSIPSDASGRFCLAPPGTGNAVEHALQRIKVKGTSADEESPKEIPGLHEGRFRFDERAFTYIPNCKIISRHNTKIEFVKARKKVRSIFNGVRNKLVHEAVYDFKVKNLGSLADGRYRVTPRKFNNSILPTAICYKNGHIEVNAHFIRIVALLDSMGLNEITNDSGREIMLLDNIIFSIAHCMIGGHFVISDNLTIEPRSDYEASQSERGTDNTRLMNIDAILFYWLSLCENRMGDDLHQRVVDFLNEKDEKTGESYYELLELRENKINFVAKRVCKLAEWSNHCRPMEYFITGETETSAYRKTKKMHKEKLYMIEQQEVFHNLLKSSL